MLTIRLGDLRRLVREEVERNVRWSAGIAPGGAARIGVTTRPTTPLPGLGPEQEEKDEQEEKEGRREE